MSIRGREGRLAATKLGLEQLGELFVRREWGVEMPHNEWLRSFGSEIYLRHFIHPHGFDQLDIANIQIRQENQRQGIFHGFLTHMERVCFDQGYGMINVENVSHPGLRRYLARRGYTAKQGFGEEAPCFVWQISNGPPIF